MKDREPPEAKRPYEDIFSFRYGKRRSRRWLVDRLRKFAREHDLSLKRTAVVFPGFSAADVASAAKLLWSPSQYRKLHKARKLREPSEVRLRRLRQPVRLIQYRLAALSGSTVVEASIAERNEYPALSADLWRKERAVFFGAFISIRSNDLGELKVVAHGIRSMLGKPVPEAFRQLRPTDRAI